MSVIPQQDEWHLRTDAEFQQFFQTGLSPVLQACERDRRNTVRNVITLLVVVSGLAAIASMMLLANSPNPMVLLFVGVGALIIAGIGYSMVTAGYRRRFKHNLVSRIVSFFGPDFNYDPEGTIDESRFKESRIFQQSIDRYNGHDYISGMAGKTRFECSEVHAQYKTTTTDAKGNRQTQWHTIFKGLYFVGDFNKRFQSTTLVLPDVAESALGWIGQKLQEWNFTRPGELVKLEDPEFEKLFVVYSTDQVESRYILSPSLMRRLTDFRRRMNHPVHVSFIDQCVFVAVDPGRELLEPKVFSPVNFEACCASFHDLCLVLGIIEELNLNTRIWSKQ